MVVHKKLNIRRRSEVRKRDIIDIGLPEIRKYYEQYYEIAVKDRLKPQVFMDILADFHEQVFQDIVFEGKIFYLPFNLGSVYITKRKPKVEFDEDFNIVKTSAALDFKAMRELWESDPEAREAKIKVYHQNDHSDNYKYSFTWSRKRSSLPGIGVYRFIPTRSARRALAKKIKTEGIPC